MRRITVAFLLPSPILNIGVSSILRRVNDVDFTINDLNPAEDIVYQLDELKPSLVVVDPAVNDCSWREICQGSNPSLRIIGVLHTQLPKVILNNLDDTFSIYDSVDVITETFRRNCIAEDTDSRAKDLSPREKDVIVGIVKGMSNKEIASEMNVSVNTVMTHRRNIAAKLHIHTPAGLTIYAIVSNLVKLEDVKNGVN